MYEENIRECKQINTSQVERQLIVNSMFITVSG